MNYLKYILFMVCATFGFSQTTPIRNPVFSGASGTLTSAGDILIHNGTTYTRLAKGSALQTLRVNAAGTGLEYATGGGGGSTTFAALTDVDLTSLASGDFLKYNGTDWVNRTAANARTDLGLGTAATLDWIEGETSTTLADGKVPRFQGGNLDVPNLRVTDLDYSATRQYTIENDIIVYQDGTGALSFNWPASIGGVYNIFWPAQNGTIVLTAGGAFTGANTTTFALTTTPTAADSLINSTAATVGAQKVSPSTVWTGNGWKTTATAASQEVSFRAYTHPVQGTTAPSGNWVLQSKIGSGSFTDRMTVSSAGLVSATSVSATSVDAATFNSIELGGSAEQTRVGTNALVADAVGTGNSAFGADAGTNFTTPEHMTVIGQAAGYFQTDGVTPLETPMRSVYLGADTKGTEADDNTIVVGHLALSEGANTTAIGTSSTTQSHLFGTLLTDASTTTRAGFRLPHGTAPTSPVNGDIWTTSAGGLYAQINGATVGPIGASGLTIGTTTITSGSSGRVLYNNAGVVGELPLGTGVATTLATNLSITGGGTIALGGYTLTVPATGTAALLGTANNFSAAQTISNSTAATNTTTGALVISGGLGLGGSFRGGGDFELTSTWGISSATGNQTMYGPASLSWGSTLGGINSTMVLSLWKDADDTLAQRRGTNAQKSRIYNTYTSTTNYERGAIEWISNVMRIGTQKGSGGGTARDMILMSDDTERVRINSSGITIGSGTAVAKLKHGTATLVAGTVTVSDSDVVAGSRIFVNRQTDGGTLGDSYSVAITAATNFVIQSKTANANVAGDTSTVSWIMVNP